MKKLIKIFYILMILSVVLIIAGITSGASVDSVKDVLTNANAYTPHEQSIDDSFTSIYIKTDNKNIDVSMSNEITKPKLDYYLKDTESVDIQVDEDGELTIDLKQDHKFLNWFSFGFDLEIYSTLYIVLPSTYEGDIKINALAGNVKLDGTYAKTYVSATFGNVFIKGSYEYLEVTQSAGNTKLEDVNVETKIVVNGQSGNIKAENVKSNDSVHLTVSAGNIEVNYVEANNFKLKSAAGNIIFRSHKALNIFELSLNTQAGNNRVNGIKVSNDYKTGTGIQVVATTNAGNIHIITSPN